MDSADAHVPAIPVAGTDLEVKDELLKPAYHDGVIIDGFPRTKVQVECLKLFYHAMLELHSQYCTTPLARFFRKPMFRIALLFVNEEVSVQRQLKRGLEKREHNR